MGFGWDKSRSRSAFDGVNDSHLVYVVLVVSVLEWGMNVPERFPFYVGLYEGYMKVTIHESALFTIVLEQGKQHLADISRYITFD